MADLPNLDNTKYIFVGKVAAIGQPGQVHGKLLQDVTYEKVEVKMGLKTYFKDPMTVPHTVDSNKSALPADLFKVGNTLIVGMLNFNDPNYVRLADQPTLDGLHKALEALVEKLVRAYLKDHNFDLTLVMDEKYAFLDGELLPLDRIIEKTYDDLHFKVGDASEASEANVRQYVEAYFQELKKKLSSDWQVTIQVGQAPQVPYWASRPQPPGTLGSWVQGQQLTLGYQSNQLGSIHTFQLSGSFLDNKHGAPIFSNALASYQYSYSRMLGNPIYASGPAQNWIYLVGTVFGQVGFGVGNNSSDPNSWNHVHIGLMGQGQGGVQLGLNIWKLVIIAQGAVVYAWVGGQGSNLGAAGFGGIQYGF